MGFSGRLPSSTELKQMKTKQDALSCASFFNRNSNQILTEVFLPNSLEITLEDVKGIPPRVEIVLYEAHEPLANLAQQRLWQGLRLRSQ